MVGVLVYFCGWTFPQADKCGSLLLCVLLASYRGVELAAFGMLDNVLTHMLYVYAKYRTCCFWDDGQCSNA